MTMGVPRERRGRAMLAGAVAVAAFAVFALWPGLADAAKPDPVLAATCTAGGTATATWSGDRVDRVYFNYSETVGVLMGSDEVNLDKPARDGAVDAPNPVPEGANRLTVGFQIHKGPNVDGVGSIWVNCS